MLCLKQVVRGVKEDEGADHFLQHLTLADDNLLELSRTQVLEVLLVGERKNTRQFEDDVGGKRLPVAIVAEQRQAERLRSLAKRLTCHE